MHSRSASGPAMARAMQAHVIHSLNQYQVRSDVVCVVTVDMVLTVHPSLPVKTVPEMIALAKSSKGALNYGSTGQGGITHLGTELFKLMAGIDIAEDKVKLQRDNAIRQGEGQR